MRQVIGDFLLVALGVAMPAALDRLRVWLTANNATVMSVLLLVIGSRSSARVWPVSRECP